MKSRALVIGIKVLGISILQFILWVFIFWFSMWLWMEFGPERVSVYGYAHLCVLIWIVFGIVVTLVNIIGTYLKGRRGISILYLGLTFVHLSLMILIFDYTIDAI